MAIQEDLIRVMFGLVVILVIVSFAFACILDGQRQLIVSLRKQVRRLEDESVELLKMYANKEDIIFDTQGGYRIVKKDDETRNTSTAETGERQSA